MLELAPFWQSCPREMGAAERITVLLVDDDPELRLVMHEVFAAYGCRVAEAEDGTHALEVVSLLRPDLVIMDLSMPRLTGWEVLARMRAERALAGIPVVVLSGGDTRVVPGAFRVLTKPVRVEELLGLLKVASKPAALADA